MYLLYTRIPGGCLVHVTVYCITILLHILYTFRHYYVILLQQDWNFTSTNARARTHTHTHTHHSRSALSSPRTLRLFNFLILLESLMT